MKNEPQGQLYNLPQFLKGPEPPKNQAIKDLEVDMSGEATSIVERNHQQAPHPVEHGVSDIDLKTQPGRETLYPNPFKQLDKGPQNAPGSQTKDLEQSQDLMIVMRSASKATPKKETELTTEKKPMSMSERFSQSLSYSQVGDKTGKTPEREKDMDRE